MALDRLITQKEAAALLGVCTRTVRSLAKSGELTPRRFGGRKLVRYDTADLERLGRPAEEQAT